MFNYLKFFENKQKLFPIPETSFMTMRIMYELSLTLQNCIEQATQQHVI